MAVSSQIEGAGLGGIRHPSLPWLAILILAPLPVFLYGFNGLAHAWAEPEFRLKPLVPLFCLGMFVGVLRSVRVPEGAVPGRWWGFALLAASLAVALLGNGLVITHAVYAGMIGYVVGLVVLVFGPKQALLFWAPLASLTLMLPIPRFIYTQIQVLLEQATFALAVPILGNIGAPVLIEGNYLNFGSIRFRHGGVTDSLRNLLPLMLFFFFFATISRLPLWLRVAPLLLALPFVVGFSVLRLVGVGYMTTRFGSADIETAIALSGGWIFLGVVALSLLLVVSLAGRAFRASQPLPPLFALAGPRSALHLPERTRPMVAAAILAGAVSAAFVLVPSPSASPPARDPLMLFPPEIGRWSSSRVALDQRVEGVLGATDYLSLSFFHPDERAYVDFWIAYYDNQSPFAAAVHSPEICLPNDGWTIDLLVRTDLPIPNGTAQSLRVNRAVISKNDQSSLVYYWFEGRGQRTASEMLAAVSYRLDNLWTGRSDGALVRYVTPILPGEEESEADARLQRFLGVTVDLLPRFIPE